MKGTFVVNHIRIKTLAVPGDRTLHEIVGGTLMYKGNLVDAFDYFTQTIDKHVEAGDGEPHLIQIQQYKDEPEPNGTVTQRRIVDFMPTVGTYEQWKIVARHFCTTWTEDDNKTTP